MADEVIDGVDGLLERERERLGRADPHHEGAGEAGSARDHDGVDVGEIDGGLGERGRDRRPERLEVRASRHLWHDAAVAGVLLHRGGDDVGEQRRAAHDADAGLVARRLDAEHEGRVAVHGRRRVVAAGVVGAVGSAPDAAPDSAGRATAAGTASRIVMASTSLGW